jgi:cell surface protein SprA
VLRDGRKSFENGLPTTAEVVNVDTTIWGRVPTLQSLVHAFDNDPNARQFQDIGLDGLNDEDERSFFSWYLDALSDPFFTVDAFWNAHRDPSADNFRHFLDREFDNVPASERNKILERYRHFTRPQGNSPSSAQNMEDFRAQQTTRPNTEDINNDNTLNEAENYFQYVVNLRPDQMNVGQNYITSIQTSTVRLRCNEEVTVNWYQFKIPIRNPDKVVTPPGGHPPSFQSIRFIRMFLKDWSENVVLRFGTLELVRNDWRAYNSPLFEDGAYITPPGTDQTEFNVSTVNVEENSARRPIPYVVPPGIERQTDWGSISNVRMNEQSLSLQVLNLADGDARAVYRITDLDLRQFRYLRMFAHAEKIFEHDDVDRWRFGFVCSLGI